jgi:hypothetical protein
MIASRHRSFAVGRFSASHVASRDRHGSERTSSAINTRQGKPSMKMTIIAATGGIGSVRLPRRRRPLHAQHPGSARDVPPQVGIAN